MESLEKVGLEIKQLRELIALASELSKWRGTLKGLKLFLETATANEGFEITDIPKNSGIKVIPFHIEVVAPEKSWPQRGLIERIIEQEKPAYVTYGLRFKKA